MGLDHDKLAHAMLMATLAHHYSELEWRLDQAINPRDPNVRAEIAGAALDMFLATADPSIVTALEPDRSKILAGLVEHRTAIVDATHRVGRRLARPPFTGPVNAIFSPLRRVNVTVVGHAATAAGDYAREARDQFLTDAPLLDSRSITWADLADRNMIVYGTADSPIVKDILAEANWQVTATYIAFGERKIEGEQLALIACRARPSDPTLADVVYTGFDEGVVVGLNALHHGPSDFVIGRKTKVGRYQIVMRGAFARGPDDELLTTLAT